MEKPWKNHGKTHQLVTPQGSAGHRVWESMDQPAWPRLRDISLLPRRFQTSNQRLARWFLHTIYDPAYIYIHVYIYIYIYICIYIYII